MISILVADDHSTFRSALRRLLDAESDMRVVGEAADGPAALLLAEELLPQVVVIDVGMLDGDGARVIRRIASSWPTIRIVGMSIYNDPVVIHEALAAGAARFVHKHFAEANLIDAIRSGGSAPGR